MTIEDVSGKPFSALKVFALSIKALRDHLMETLDKQGSHVSTEEIRWVLTVPAIWNDSAKQFMREAGKQVVPKLINTFICLTLKVRI